MSDWTQILSKELIEAMGPSKLSSISRCQAQGCGRSNFIVETEESRSHGEVCYVARCLSPGCYRSAWYVCGLCGCRRKKRGKMTRHHEENHMSDVRSQSNQDWEFPGSVDNTNLEDDEVATVQPQHSFTTYLNEKSLKYLQYDLRTDGGGANMLVSCAFEQSGQPTGVLQPCEVEFHLHHMKLLTCLNTGQRESHARLMAMLQAKDRLLTRTIVPASVTEFQTYYLERKFSVAQNVPRPRVLKDVARHARVSVADCIEHFLAFNDSPIDDLKLYGRVPEFVDTSITKRRNDSRAAQRIRDRVLRRIPTAPADTLLLLIERWSDDFERNNIRSAGRKSIWVCTITIMAPHDRPTDTDYTFVVGLGWKGDDHAKLEQHLQKELDVLSCYDGNPTYMYSRRHGKTIPVVVETLVEVFDRPELSSVKGNVHHRGLTGERRDFSAILKTTRIQSCNACLDGRVRRLRELESGRLHPRDLKEKYPCQQEEPSRKCADYEIDCDSGPLDIPISDKFPRRVAVGTPTPPSGREAGITCARPVRLSDCYFVSGATYTWYNMVATPKFGGWSLTESTEYWKYLGLQEKYLREMKALARTFWNSDEWGSYTRAYATAKREAEKQGGEPPLPQWKCPPFPTHLFPSSWFSVAEDYIRRCCINPVMHCLFLGVIKTGVAAEVKTWLKAHYRNKNFLATVVDLMEAIKTLSIDWCRLESFGPGWVSDTCLALARCFKVVYSRVRVSVGSSTLRGLDEFERLVPVTNLMVALIMDDEASLEKSFRLRETIKCFLALCRQWWLAWNEEDKNGYDHAAFYRTKPNFFSMLNFVEQSLEFGPAPLYWDGNRERYIQMIKPEIGTPRKNSTYLHTLLDKVHKKVAVNSLVSTELPKEDQTGKRFQAMKTYSNKDALDSAVDDSMPLSGALVRTASGEMEEILCYRLKNIGRSQSRIGYAKVSLDDTRGVSVLAAWYAPITVTDTERNLEGLHELDIVDYIVLLPWEGSADEPTLYTIVSRGWKERTKRGTYAWPALLTESDDRS